MRKRKRARRQRPLSITPVSIQKLYQDAGTAIVELNHWFEHMRQHPEKFNIEQITEYGKVVQNALNTYSGFQFKEYILFLERLEECIQRLKCAEDVRIVEKKLEMLNLKMRRFLRDFGCELIEPKCGDPFNQETMYSDEEYQETMQYRVTYVFSKGYIYRNYRGDVKIGIPAQVEIEQILPDDENGDDKENGKHGRDFDH